MMATPPGWPSASPLPFQGRDLPHRRMARWQIRSADGRTMAEPPRWALARERVRHAGEPVAAVIAETIDQALAAAECVEAAYAPLDAVVDADAAIEASAPRLHAAAPG